MSAADAWNLQWLQRQRAINGGPLPVVDPRSTQSVYDTQQTAKFGQPAPDTWAAWQHGLPHLPAAQQDTAGGEGAQGPWSDNSPVQGGQSSGQAGGAFGTTYTDPGGGWNPWSLYDSRQGYDGTAVDGYYNAAADTVRHDSGRGDGSTMSSRETVWRWTLDDLGKQYGGNPGSAPPEAVKAAFLNNVARLKRDWNAPENAGRGDWANSGFAGYDRLAQGGQGGAAQSQGGGVGDGGGQGGAAGAARNAADTWLANKGGSNVSAPSYPSPVPTLEADVNGSGKPNPIINPTTGTTTPGAFGAAGFVNQSDPEGATRAYMRSHGIDPDSNGFFGDFIRKLMGNIVPMLMSFTLGSDGKPAMDQLGNLNAIMDPIFYGGAGTLGGNLGGFADKAQTGLRGAMGGLDPNTQVSLLQNLSALRTLGQNPYLATATNKRLDNSINAAKDFAHSQALGGHVDPAGFNLGDWIAKQPGMAGVLQGWK